MSNFSATNMASLLSSSQGHSSLIVTESSCQFFMKSPMTSYPCFCKRWAATLESTPPLSPTTTRFPFTTNALCIRLQNYENLLTLFFVVFLLFAPGLFLIDRKPIHLIGGNTV